MGRLTCQIKEIPDNFPSSSTFTEVPVESKALVKLTQYFSVALEDSITPVVPTRFVTETLDTSRTGQERYFRGVVERVVFRETPDGKEPAFDLALSRYVRHALGHIAYRLLYGEPIMGVGVGVTDFIGSKIDEAINVISLYMADTIGKLMEYGWKGQVITTDIRQSELNRTVLEIFIETIEPSGE